VVKGLSQRRRDAEKVGSDLNEIERTGWPVSPIQSTVFLIAPRLRDSARDITFIVVELCPRAAHGEVLGQRSVERHAGVEGDVVDVTLKALAAVVLAERLDL